MSWIGVFGLAVLTVEFSATQILAAADLPPVEAVEYVEEWRTADDEETPYVLGTVSCVRSGGRGQVYLFDSQQTLLHGFGPDGQHTGVLAQRGEGPGELPGGYVFYVWPDDRLAIPRRGASIMLLDGAGQYLESIPLDSGNAGWFGTPPQVWNTGRRILVRGTRIVGAGPHAGRESVLALFETSGKLALELQVAPVPARGVEPGTIVYRERGYFFAGARHVVGDDGQIYIATRRDEFYLEVRDGEGELTAEIRAPIEPFVRSPEQIEAAKGKFSISASPGVKLPDIEYDIEPLEPPIRGLHWVSGELWVEVATDDQVEGRIGRFVTFDEAGSVKLVQDLIVPHDPDRDGWHLLANGRIAIVENLRQARAAASAGSNTKGGRPAPEDDSSDDEGVIVVIHRPDL